MCAIVLKNKLNLNYCTRGLSFIKTRRLIYNAETGSINHRVMETVKRNS